MTILIWDNLSHRITLQICFLITRVIYLLAVKKKNNNNHKLYVDRCYVDIESESALSSRSPEVTCSNGWSCTHCSAVCFI